jgi:hypothetical protein
VPESGATPELKPDSNAPEAPVLDQNTALNDAANSGIEGMPATDTETQEEPKPKRRRTSKKAAAEEEPS